MWDSLLTRIALSGLDIFEINVLLNRYQLSNKTIRRYHERPLIGHTIMYALCPENKARQQQQQQLQQQRRHLSNKKDVVAILQHITDMGRVSRQVSNNCCLYNIGLCVTQYVNKNGITC